jgi:hypothetical protein
MRRKIARLHLAKMNKRASVFDTLKSKITATLINDEAEKQQKMIGGSALKGLQSIAKESGVNTPEKFLSIAKNAKPDMNDPLTKLINERLSSAKNNAEAGFIAGQLKNAYDKEDYETMAKLLKVEPETLAVVLLWYVKDKKSAWVYDDDEVKAALPPSNKQASAGSAILIGYLKFSATVATQILSLLGTAIGWILHFILPTSITGSYTWKALLLALGGLKASISMVLGLVWKILLSIIAWATSSLTIIGSLKLIGGGLALYYLFLFCSWFMFKAARVPARVLVEIPLKLILKAVKYISKGALKLLSRNKAEAEEAIQEAKDNLSDDPQALSVLAPA